MLSNSSYLTRFRTICWASFKLHINTKRVSCHINFYSLHDKQNIAKYKYSQIVSNRLESHNSRMRIFIKVIRLSVEFKKEKNKIKINTALGRRHH